VMAKAGSPDRRRIERGFRVDRSRNLAGFRRALRLRTRVRADDFSEKGHQIPYLPLRASKMADLR
jgi:hypothetical protein